MKKKPTKRHASAIGPRHIWLPDSIASQIADMSKAVIVGSKTGKLRGIFAQITVHRNVDAKSDMCLTCYCPTNKDGAQFVEAINALGLFKGRSK